MSGRLDRIGCAAPSLAAALLAVGTVHAEPALPWPDVPEHPLHFEARVGDDTVGTLTIDFARDDGETVVRQREHVRLRRLLLSAEIEQAVESRWSGDRLSGLTALTRMSTSFGSEHLQLAVHRAADGALLVESGDRKSELPADLWPTMFWHKALALRSQALDTLRGELVGLRAKRRGFEMVVVAGGPALCERIDVDLRTRGKTVPIGLWFDASGTLCAMRRESALGDLRYLRVAPPLPSPATGQGRGGDADVGDRPPLRSPSSTTRSASDARRFTVHRENS